MKSIRMNECLTTPQHEKQIGYTFGFMFSRFFSITLNQTGLLLYSNYKTPRNKRYQHCI